MKFDASEYQCEENCLHAAKMKKARQSMLSWDMVLRLSETFKALGDPTRIKIINALKTTELCVCDLAAVLGMGQSAVSHQLRVLRNLHLVKYRKEGKSTYYSLDDDHIVKLFEQGIEHIEHL